MRKDKIKEIKKLIDEFRTIKKIKVNNKENPFLSIKSSEYILNNGRKIIRERILKKNNDGSAVIILPITSEGDIIFSVQPRVLTELTVGVELPAGYIEKKELPENTVYRELREETGFVPKKIIKIGEFYQDTGCSSALNKMYLALNCEKLFDQDLDKDEIIKLFKCKYDEAFELMELGYIKDCNSILTLEKSKKYLKEG